MDFVEHMAEYLESSTFDPDTATVKALEEKYPGFKERVAAFDANCQGYRSTGDDDLLVYLLKESFVLDGMFEEERIIKMQAFWKRAEEKAKDWFTMDLTLKSE